MGWDSKGVSQVGLGPPTSGFVGCRWLPDTGSDGGSEDGGRSCRLRWEGWGDQIMAVIRVFGGGVGVRPISGRVLDSVN